MSIVFNYNIVLNYNTTFSSRSMLIDVQSTSYASTQTIVENYLTPTSSGCSYLCYNYPYVEPEVPKVSYLDLYPADVIMHPRSLITCEQVRSSIRRPTRSRGQGLGIRNFQRFSDAN